MPNPRLPELTEGGECWLEEKEIRKEPEGAGILPVEAWPWEKQGMGGTYHGRRRRPLWGVFPKSFWRWGVNGEEPQYNYDLVR